MDNAKPSEGDKYMINLLIYSLSDFDRISKFAPS